jgi:hypothetical protein
MIYRRLHGRERKYNSWVKKYRYFSFKSLASFFNYPALVMIPRLVFNSA